MLRVRRKCGGAGGDAAHISRTVMVVAVAVLALGGGRAWAEAGGDTAHMQTSYGRALYAS